MGKNMQLVSSKFVGQQPLKEMEQIFSGNGSPTVRSCGPQYVTYKARPGCWFRDHQAKLSRRCSYFSPRRTRLAWPWEGKTSNVLKISWFGKVLRTPFSSNKHFSVQSHIRILKRYAEVAMRTDTPSAAAPSGLLTPHPLVSAPLEKHWGK